MGDAAATSKELPRPPPPPKSPLPPPQQPPPYTYHDNMAPPLELSQIPVNRHPYTPGQSNLYTSNPVPQPLRSLNRRHAFLAVPFLVILTFFLSRTISFPMALPGFPASPKCDHATSIAENNASELRVHPTPLATIPPATLKEKKRIIFVGDVHGELQHLHSLLDKVKYDNAATSDIVVLLGDMISKGPDSAGVVDWARGQPKGSVYCVRGNHEHRVLTIADKLEGDERRRHKKSPHGKMDAEEEDEEDESDEEAEDVEGSAKRKRKHGSKGEDRARRLAKKLTKEQKDWLSACPVMLQIPVFLQGGRETKGKKEGIEYLAVHAGLEAGVKLQDQDLSKVMNLRLLDKPAILDIDNDSDNEGSEDETGESGDEDNNSDGENDEDEDDDDAASLDRRRKHNRKGRKHGRKHRKQIHWAALWNRWMSGKLPQLLPPNIALDPAPSSGASSDDATPSNSHHSRGTRAVVVYGHFAARGLDIREWTKGLDSGCQRGGRLTSLILDLESGKEKLVSVGCSKKKGGKHGKGIHDAD